MYVIVMDYFSLLLIWDRKVFLYLFAFIELHWKWICIGRASRGGSDAVLMIVEIFDCLQFEIFLYKCVKFPFLCKNKVDILIPPPLICSYLVAKWSNSGFVDYFLLVVGYLVR